MTRFLLHIGRHKTGSSSLQRFFFKNSDALLQYGYFYPKAGLKNIAHHPVADCFNPQKKISSGDLSGTETILESLQQDIEGCNKTVLLSSEAFQNSDPELVGRFFAPGDVRIVIYIREQVDYIISAYQQVIHAKLLHCTLDAYSTRVVVDYDRFLSRWEQVFGRHNIDVRIYDRTLLKNNNIVEDFMAYLGINGMQEFEYPRDEVNPSIGGVLLEFKRLVNACGPYNHSTRGRFYNLLSVMAAEKKEYRIKPGLSIDLQKTIRDTCARSNQQVFNRYFNGQSVFVTQLKQPPAPVVMDNEVIVEILDWIRQRHKGVFYNLVSIFLTAYLGADWAPRRMHEVHLGLKRGELSLALKEAIEFVMSQHNFR